MAARRLELYRFGGMTLDLARGLLRNGSGDVRLRPKSFDLLIYFVTNADRLLSKDELLQAVWPGVFVTEDSLVQCVKEIRRAVGDREQVLIKTIPGRGYIFDLPVTAVEVAEPSPAGSTRLPRWLRHNSVFDWRIATLAGLVLLSIGLGWWLRALPVAATAPPRLSIVVLPFVNLSNDLEQEYFADGLTDNLTTDVSYIEGSFVIARNTAFAYKGMTVDTRKIGRELGVRYVLEGSVKRSADQIRINAQLIDAETASQLWAESFDRDRSDLYVIEDEVTKLIARTLDRQLTKIEAEQAARRSPNGNAVDYIMRGDAILQRHVSKDSYRAAEGLYERALQLDPRFPRALTGVAGMLVSRVLNDFSDAREDDLRRADELVSRALAIDPNYADAHDVKGQILRARRRYEEAIAEYETEVALNPLAVSGLSDLARTEILLGEPAKAVPLLERAMRISPRDSGIGYLQWRLGYANLLLGNTNEAVKWSQKSVVTFYDKTSAYLNLAAALGLMGDNTAAQAALAEAIKLDPDHSATTAKVRAFYSGSNRPKFVKLREQTLIEGLRKAGLPEE